METRGKKTTGTRELRSATKTGKNSASASTSTPPTATRPTRAATATNKEPGDQLSGSQTRATKSRKAPEDASQTKKQVPKAAPKATPVAPSLNKRTGTLDDNDREPIKVRRHGQAYYIT
jgi:eukaryotic-like serine/threonine-protein kinase